MQVLYANIVQAVKKCYKRKIDYRELRSVFLCFLRGRRPLYIQLGLPCLPNVVLLEDKEALNAMQREYYWRAIVVLLQKKESF